MKARYFARTGNSSGISAKDRRVINAEINRQILEKDAEYRDNLDAVILYLYKFISNIYSTLKSTYHKDTKSSKNRKILQSNI